MNYSIPEPAPIPNDNPSIHDLVIKKLSQGKFFRLIKHIEDRKRFGLEKYGTILQAHNGRAVLTDAFQDALDALIYLMQAMVEEGSEERLSYSFHLACELADSIRDELMVREKQ